MDELSLNSSLALYNSQIHQIEMGIAAADDENTRLELNLLLSEMHELVKLTEESLLSLKKGHMLQSINVDEEDKLNKQNNVTNQLNVEDAEYEAFMKSIQGENSAISSDTDESQSNSTETQNESIDFIEEMESSNETLNSIVGTKCRVPYRENWGPTSLHNCMVCAVEPIESGSDPKIRVFFCNPTTMSMKPCSYYLDGSCKFDEDGCRFSHGYLVPISDLQEFLEPDLSQLNIGSSCLAKYSGDDLWYGAVVVEIEENFTMKVMFNNYDEVELKSLDEIIPSDANELKNLEILSTESEDEELEDFTRCGSSMPTLLSVDALGEWEKHTKGIGSKLMIKMGYIVGQGLGKDGSGKVSPVPIQVLPSGKSLDKIMEMKEKAQNKDLFDPLHRKKKFAKQTNNAVADGYKKIAKPDVFEFLNQKISKSNVKNVEMKKKNSTPLPTTVIEKKDLKSYSDKHLNIQLFQTSEEVRNVDRELKKLKESMKRNSTSDVMTQKFKKKVIEMESYKKQLESSGKSIENFKNKRKDKNKLFIF